MALSFNSPHKFEKNITENGTPFYIINFSKNDDGDEVEFSDILNILSEHQKIPGIVFYCDENNFFYLLRNDDATIWGKKKGNVDVEKAYVYALLTKKNSKILSCYSHIDDFWLRTTRQKINKIEQGKKIYSEIGNEIQDTNIKLFNILTEKGNYNSIILSNEKTTLEEQNKAKENLEKVLRISLNQLEICQKLQVYYEKLQSLIREL